MRYRRPALPSTAIAWASLLVAGAHGCVLPVATPTPAPVSRFAPRPPVPTATTGVRVAVTPAAQPGAAPTARAADVALAVLASPPAIDAVAGPPSRPTASTMVEDRRAAPSVAAPPAPTISPAGTVVPDRSPTPPPTATRLAPSTMTGSGGDPGGRLTPAATATSVPRVATATSAATAMPRATPSATPTAPPTATPTVAVTRITFLREPGIVFPGRVASLVVRAAPGAGCSASVTYRNSQSHAAGLGTRTAGASGEASWSWTVEGDAPIGIWPTQVTCGGVSLTTYLYVP
ncbi:MAG TPA: hypothetical protein VFC93_16645 [Chloroflexota bacterium]|nr:hypothetical protein [Chloroflexota bacterium]